MSIPPRFLDEIRSRVTLSDMIGRRIKVTRAGREYKACCPFHHEKTPSFTINDDKQFYHCFGCGAHGDVIGFVMQHDNLSFIDAVEMLAGEAGLVMPKPDPAYAKKAEEQRGLHELMDAATSWFAQQLKAPHNQDVADYLNQRGLKPETIEAFRIGYAPADRQQLRSYLNQQGFTDAQMLEAGMLKKSDRNGELYVFFRDRVMFPVADRRGRVIAFGGRAMPEHIRPPQGDFKPPKYLNSSDTTLFDKSRTLYAESQARQAARDEKPVIVTEGYMDVIACHAAGFTGAVAPMGTSLTDEQIAMLWSMIPDDNKVPILCFDGDNAGRKAAARACENILPVLRPGQSVKFAFLPDGEDPDSLIKAGGPAAFQKILNASLSLFDFLWALHVGGREFKTPEERARVSDTLRGEVRKIADRNVQIHYDQLMNAKISEAFFPRRQNYNGGKNQPGRTGRPAPVRPAAVRPRPPVFRDIYIRALMACVVNHPYIYEQVEEAFGSFHIADSALGALRQSIAMALSEQPDLDTEGLSAHLTGQGLEKERDDICSESVYVHAAFAAPSADSHDVQSRWMELYRVMQEQGLDQEIKAGWREALSSADEEGERKLRNILGGAGRDEEKFG